jgi:seryl-tRNA synthetase
MNAEVTMPLSELDALRNERNELAKQVTELESKQKQVMEDVIMPIQQEEKRKVQALLDNNGKRIAALESQLSVKDTEHKESVRTIIEGYERKIKLLMDQKEENTKDTIIGSLTSRVDELIARIKEYSTHPWYERIFTKIDTE